MSDLISKEVLLERIRNKGFSENPDIMFEEIIGTIEEQPTAYDVESVVAELKKNTFQSLSTVVLAGSLGVQFVSSGKAIEIARNGGKGQV